MNVFRYIHGEFRRKYEFDCDGIGCDGLCVVFALSPKRKAFLSRSPYIKVMSQHVFLGSFSSGLFRVLFLGDFPSCLRTHYTYFLRRREKETFSRPLSTAIYRTKTFFTAYQK